MVPNILFLAVFNHIMDHNWVEYDNYSQHSLQDLFLDISVQLYVLLGCILTRKQVDTKSKNYNSKFR